MSKKSMPRRHALSNARPVLDFLCYALALVGFLVVVHLWIQTQRGFDRGCFGFSQTIEAVGCEAVVTSDAGKLLGISNVIWGLLFYIAVGVLSFRVIRSTAAKLRSAKLLRTALITVGVAYSAYLVYVQSMQIGEYCKLCMISAGIVAVMGLVTVTDAVTNPKPRNN